MSITNGIVSSKIYDQWDDYNFEIVNIPFLDGDVPRSPSYGIYISQLNRFARVCSNVHDFNNRNLFLTAKLLKQGYRYYKIRKAFSKFYHRHSELIVKCNIGLKMLELNISCTSTTAESRAKGTSKMHLSPPPPPPPPPVA